MELPGSLTFKRYICMNEIFGVAHLMVALNWGQNSVIWSTHKLTIAYAVAMIVLMAGKVGGCNLNPAVTLAMLIKEKD